MDDNDTERYDMHDNRQRQRTDEGTLKYTFIRNSMPRWIGRVFCTATKRDTQRIDQ